jgi:hypothetical protein
MTENFDAHQKYTIVTPTPEYVGSKQRAFRPEYVAGQVRKRETTAATKRDAVHANGVVILNGNQRETRVFNSKGNGPVRNLPPDVVGIAAAGSKNRSTPVVVGISSNAHQTKPVVVNIASAESNAQPVVVGIASSGFQNAGTVAPVAVGVSPRPAKRPPYRPAALDAQ